MVKSKLSKEERKKLIEKGEGIYQNEMINTIAFRKENSKDNANKICNNKFKELNKRRFCKKGVEKGFNSDFEA